MVLVHKVPADGEFTLNDLAGSGGRMDEVAAVVASAFLVSNGIRRDTELTLLLVADPSRPRAIRLSGARLKFLNPDERSTAALLKNALVRSLTRPTEEMETTPGIRVGPARPTDDLNSFLKQPGTVWATEGGSPLREHSPAGVRGEDVGAVLSDPFNPSPEEEALLRASGAPQVSVGPRSLRSSQCVVLLHNEWDLRELAAAGQGKGATPAATP